MRGTVARAVAALALVATLGIAPRALGPHAIVAAAPVGCTIASSSMPFPQYNPLSTTASSFSGTISLTACIGIDISVALGTGGANSFAPRKMASASNAKINYNLYQDSGLNTIWGDGTGGTKPVTFTIVAGSETIPIYGNVPGAQIVPAGTYSDAVTITISTF